LRFRLFPFGLSEGTRERQGAERRQKPDTKSYP
jgi:hypothetical protein